MARKSRYPDSFIAKIKADLVKGILSPAEIARKHHCDSGYVTAVKLGRVGTDVEPAKPNKELDWNSVFS